CRVDIALHPLQDGQRRRRRTGRTIAQDIAAQCTNRLGIAFEEGLLVAGELQVFVEFVNRGLENRRRLTHTARLRPASAFVPTPRAAAPPAAILGGGRERSERENARQQRALPHAGWRCSSRRWSSFWRCSGVSTSRTRCMLCARRTARLESAFACVSASWRARASSKRSAAASFVSSSRAACTCFICS